MDDKRKSALSQRVGEFATQDSQLAMQYREISQQLENAS